MPETKTNEKQPREVADKVSEETRKKTDFLFWNFEDLRNESFSFGVNGHVYRVRIDGDGRAHVEKK